MLSWSKMKSGVTELLNNKLLNRSCVVLPQPLDRYRILFNIIYRGSTDPGTIKSKYIPEAEEIQIMIINWFRSKKKYNIQWEESRRSLLSQIHSPAGIRADWDVDASQFHPDIRQHFDLDLQWSGWGKKLVIIKGEGSTLDIYTPQDIYEIIIAYYYPTEIRKAVLGNAYGR